MYSNERYPQAQGDIERVLSENQQSVERFVRMRVPAGEWEDIAAEAMCQFVAYVHEQQREIQQPRALLFTIVRRRIADYHEARTQRGTTVPLEEAPPLAAPESLPQRVDARTELSRVRSALDILRDEERDLILLSATAGLTTTELAALMETSPGAVRVRLFKARAKLKRVLRTEERKVEALKHGALKNEVAT